MSGKKLAVLFPGVGYHCDKPLLYYSKKYVASIGYEVVEVSYTFDLSAGNIKTDFDKMKEAFKQAYAQTRSQLSTVAFDQYEQVLFVGKSIGTVVAAKYGADHGLTPRQVVFTPVPQTFDYLAAGENFVLHGTADPMCPDDVVMAAKEKLGFHLEMIQDGNHSLETKDTIHNIHLMADMINQVKMYLLDGNDEAYSSQKLETIPGHKLAGKRILFLGSSVTYGYASMQDALPEYFAKRFGCESVKEAISGTTLVDREEISYVNRLKKYDASEKFDMVVCQLSTNDANLRLSMGTVAAGFALEDFDALTITGAMEYIIAYAKKNWDCPVYFYTNARYDHPLYGQMVDRLFALQMKWGIGVFDLWKDETWNTISDADRSLYMADPIHPTKAGYMRWWGPEIERQLEAE